MTGPHTSLSAGENVLRLLEVEPLKEFIASQEPDLWALTGDLVESRRGLELLRDVLAGIRARRGVLGVMGNNDYRLGTSQGALRQVFAEVGVHMLFNESSGLDGLRGVWIAGVEDPSRCRDNLPQALDGSACSAFRLLLAHSADIAHEAAEAQVELVLVGHSHGGQICLPWIGPLIAGTKRLRLGRRFAQGPLALDRTLMYVCRGIGTSVVPVRTWCRREIAQFLFRRAEEQPAQAGAPWP